MWKLINVLIFIDLQTFNSCTDILTFRDLMFTFFEGIQSSSDGSSSPSEGSYSSSEGSTKERERIPKIQRRVKIKPYFSWIFSWIYCTLVESSNRPITMMKIIIIIIEVVCGASGKNSLKSVSLFTDAYTVYSAGLSRRDADSDC